VLKLIKGGLKMNNKRGQAAMEFLMTYGWAILAAVIVIGVLAYFGVFSPSTYVPNQCIVSAPFGCNAGVANVAGVTLELRNGAGETLNVTSVAVAGCGTVNSVGSAAADSLTTVTVPCTLTANTKFKGDITVSYRKMTSNLDVTSSGQLVSKVA
jgi:uncharacterized protein (UPF0333 family)